MANTVKVYVLHIWGGYTTGLRVSLLSGHVSADMAILLAVIFALPAGKSRKKQRTAPIAVRHWIPTQNLWKLRLPGQIIHTFAF